MSFVVYFGASFKESTQLRLRNVIRLSRIESFLPLDLFSHERNSVIWRGIRRFHHFVLILYSFFFGIEVSYSESLYVFLIQSPHGAGTGIRTPFSRLRVWLIS